jgi:hypothetical protein
MNGNDTYLDVNNAHLRVTSGNVHASGFNLDQISIVTTSNTGSTINFLNDTKGFMSRSNIEVGTANLFVDTTTSRVGIGTDAPAYTLDVHGSANVGVITTTDINVTGNLAVLGTTTTVDTDNLRVKDPIIELGKGNAASPVVDLGLILTRPTGSSNVAIIYDESTDNLEIGYTQGNASQSIITMETAAANPISVNVNGTISGNGSGLTALPAAQITGTLDAARIPALDTAKITTGTLDAARIPALDTAKITTGTLDAARIPALDTAKITTGTLDAARIPTLNQNTTGSAGSATTAGTAATLTTARTIGGVAFDGSAAIVPTTFNGATFDTDTLVVDATNDRVGIGEESPTQLLHVRGAGPQLFIEGASNEPAIIRGSSGPSYRDKYHEIAMGFYALSGFGTSNYIDFKVNEGGESNSPSTRMRIRGDGNVGIGVTNPDARLHIEEPASISATTRLFHTETGFTGGSRGHFEIMEEKVGSGTGWSDFACRLQRRVDTTVQSYIDFNPSGSTGDYGIAFGNSGGGGPGEIMRIDGLNGRVGIGTTNPGEHLHIYHPTYGVHRSVYWNAIEGATTDLKMGYLGSSDPSHASGALGLFKNSYEGSTEDETVRIQGNGVSWFNGGNVGIGTTTPDCNLEIYGDTSSLKLTRSKNNTNYGCSVDFALLNSANEKFTYGRVSGSIADNTNGSEDGLLSFQVGTNGSMGNNYQQEKMRILSNGNVGIGTSSPGAKLHVNGGELRVTNADTAVARIALYGSSQGTGQVFVGQSAQYGGGIEYNGDNSPVSTGAGADYITLYRVNVGTFDWTARNSYASNNWEFRGNVKTPLLDMNGTTMSKAPRVIHIDDSRSGCPPTQAANTSIMEYSLALARSAYVFVSVTTILNHTSRADCQILFGGVIQQSHLTASDSTNWNPVCMTAGGTIGAGTTNIQFRCAVANVVGCQSDWGGMQILVFEQ